MLSTALRLRYRIVLILWLISDLIVFVGTYVLAYFLRVGWILSSDFPFDRFFITTLTVAPLWLLVLATTRTFHFTRNQMTLRNAAYIAYTALVGVALFTLAYYFRYNVFFSRLLLAEAFVLSASATFLWHMLYQRVQRTVLVQDPPSFPTLIVGVTRESVQLIEVLLKKKNPLRPVAILDGRGAKEDSIHGIPVVGKLNKLEQVLEEKKISHLIQCADLEQSLNLLSVCRQRDIHYILLPSVLGIVERDERVESLEGRPVTMVSPRRPWQWFF